MSRPSAAHVSARAVVIVIAASICLARAASSQEPIENHLERGYVSNWLVCGPFDPPSDGIVTRAARNLLPLGDVDHLEPVGGVRRVRPEDGERVAIQGGERIWRSTTAESERLDLYFLVQGEHEGVVYAAFSAYAGVPVDVLIDFECLLGARGWLNGFPMFMPAPVAPTTAGLYRQVVRLRTGQNLFLFEIPVAPVSAVADALSLTVDALRDTVQMHRPLLTEPNGFEFALRLLPVNHAGSLVYVPRLRTTGSFTGSGDGLNQELSLGVFNPGPGTSEPAAVRYRFGEDTTWAVKNIRSLPPGTWTYAMIGMPVAGIGAGESQVAHVEFEHGGVASGFSTRVSVRPSPARGTAHLITGLIGGVGDAAQSQLAAQRSAALARHMAFLNAEPGYGFYLGGAESWLPYVVELPGARAALGQAVARGFLAPNAGYTVPDERIVSGELLARNLLYGQRISRDVLGRSGLVYYAWSAKGIAPQHFQLLADAGILGRVDTNTGIRAEPFSLGFAMNGTALPERYAGVTLDSRDGSALLADIEQQRDVSVRAGFDADVYALSTPDEAAPPYLLGQVAAMRDAIPSIDLSGSGGERFFESVREYAQRKPDVLATLTQSPAMTELGSVLAQRPLKDAYTHVESALNVSERYAALAAMSGAPYPGAALDRAWKQLLFYSAPEILGRASTPIAWIDALAAYREAAHTARDVSASALSAIADRINTASAAPRNPEPAQALVVFNPSSFARSDVCRWLLPGNSTAVRVLDGAGNSVPFAVDAGASGPVAVFIARDVPGFGYKTYYLVSGGTPNAPRPANANTIENEFFRIVADPARGGAIVNLESKATATGFIGGIANDVVLIDEDPAQTRGGRELWGTRVMQRASDANAQVQSIRTEVFEQLRIQSTFAGGELIRTITLYSGVPRVDCETTFRQINAQDRLLALRFDTVPQGQSFIAGQPYGVLTATQGSEPDLFRTDSGALLNDALPYSAQYFAALSPNDGVRAGADVAVPFAPALIVLDDQEQYAAAADKLARALFHRGIPSVVMPSQAGAAAELLPFESLDAAVAQGYRFPILLGNADENAVVATAEQSLDESSRAAFGESLANGYAFLIGDANWSTNALGRDALIIAGGSVSRTDAMIADIVDSIRTTGSVTVPPTSYIGRSPRPQPTNGLAVLFHGTRVAASTRDGALTLALAHDSTWDAEDTSIPIELAPLDFTVQYSLMPIDGDWRAAAVPQHAHAFSEPLTAVTTPLHLGELDPEASLLSTTGAGFVVTALKGVPDGGATGSASSYVLRGYSVAPSTGSIHINTRAPMQRAWRTDPAELSQHPLSGGSGGIRFDVNPFQVVTHGFTVTAGRAAASRAADAKRTVDMRYWRTNDGASPAAPMPVVVLFEGDLDDPAGAITVSVTNNQRDALIGEVRLTPSTGWNLAPSELPLSLAPGETLLRSILITRPGASDGGVIATVDTGDAVYRDVVLTTGAPFDLVAERKGNEVVAIVRNRVGLPLSGRVELIASPEGWNELPHASNALTPWRDGFAIGPMAEYRAAFVWTGSGAPQFYAVKAAGFGHVVYAGVPGS